jgi:hypothetical protein
MPVGVAESVDEVEDENSPEKIAIAATKPTINTMRRIDWNDDFIVYFSKSIA